MVLIPGADQVLRLTGEQTEAFDAARAGVNEVADHLAAAMAGRVELGVVTTDTWSRRRIIQLGGAAAARVTVIALPSIAAASSGSGGTTLPGTTSTTGRKPTYVHRHSTTQRAELPTDARESPMMRAEWPRKSATMRTTVRHLGRRTSELVPDARSVHGSNRQTDQTVVPTSESTDPGPAPNRRALLWSM
ncbi:MAG: hypothetical protein JST73_09205 [Actinobacteria bacterium]|nr:hypothetical protein [Actinomycetota bacterium]